MQQADHQWFEENLPWQPFTAFAGIIEKQPTLLACEVLFVGCSLLTLKHALDHGRHHVLVWFTSVIAGTANDIFFMVLPFSDNFYHAQCSIMLTPRLPLYIPCAYISFMYVGTVSAWRLGLAPVAEAAATGLACAVFYAAFDITGAKHLWWTWHDTDGGVFHRWLGVPIGSTMWTLVYTFCYQLLHRWLILHVQRPDIVALVGTTLWTALLATPMMMLAMGPFQMHQLRLGWPSDVALPVVTQIPGMPDAISIALVIALFGFLVRRGLLSANRKPYPWLEPRPASDGMLLAGVLSYYGALVFIMATAEPEAVVANGVHQPINPCYVVGHDLSNRSRYEFLCPTDFAEDFTFDCAGGVDYAATLPDRSTWYTLCGKPHSNRALYVAAVSLIATAGSWAFTRMLTTRKAK